MTKKYRLVFHYLIKPENYFREKMSMLGVSSEAVQKILKKAPVVLREDSSLEYLKKYANAVIDAGGRVDIRLVRNQEADDRSVMIEPMKNFVLCSECGLKQLRKQACEKCGRPLPGIGLRPETE